MTSKWRRSHRIRQTSHHTCNFLCAFELLLVFTNIAMRLFTYLWQWLYWHFVSYCRYLRSILNVLWRHVVKITPELNTDFACPHVEICHTGFYNSETMTSNFVFLNVNHITSNSCWRNLTFSVSYCRDERGNLYDTIYCKISLQSKKR